MDIENSIMGFDEPTQVLTLERGLGHSMGVWNTLKKKKDDRLRRLGEGDRK